MKSSVFPFKFFHFLHFRLFGASVFLRVFSCIFCPLSSPYLRFVAEVELEIFFRVLSPKPFQTAEYGEGSVNRDEEYCTWMPPEEQAGDGTTALNAKFAGRY